MRMFIGCLVVCGGKGIGGEDGALLGTWPTMSRTEIVFLYGGYLWSVPRDGGEASQLTTGGHETNPVFSPDGRWIAFTGEYDGNVGVSVMPAAGGEPKRMTWHPTFDVVVGWNPDGKRILFRSGRESYADFDRLYTVPIEGGVPDVLPMWRGEAGSYSPDGEGFAYVPDLKWQGAGKRYCGGDDYPGKLVGFKKLALEKRARGKSTEPKTRVGRDTVYFT